jgi:hypothetical protein
MNPFRRIAWGCALPLVLACSLPARAAERTPIALPGGGSVKKVDFERHVMALFGRLGCNNGSCHGSFQGKGGFRLSLFGYAPEKDYLALTREARGRRVNRTDPARSLLLLKPTGQVPHEGQTRFGKSSWAYQLLRAWLDEGAPWKKGSGDVRSVRITPAEQAFKGPGQSGSLRVQATFKDGTTEDVTPLCDFRSSEDAVAEVNNLGRVKALRPGDTAIIVSYRGQVIPVRVLVPAVPAKDFRYPAIRPANYIDREVLAKLRRLNMVPSDLCSDGEFLRRVTLDTIGTLPTPAQVRAFLADKRIDKRARKIDELLAHPMHAALWATRFCDITGNNTDRLENPPQRKFLLSQMWHDWFRKRLAANVPYDEMVRGVLTATSREGKSPEEYLELVKETEEKCEKGEADGYAERSSLDLFWRRQQRVLPNEWGEKTAAAFLGVRLECAQCHKHPFDRWTQEDYRAYANVFAPLTFAASPEAQKLFRTENQARNKANRARQLAFRKNRKRKRGERPPIPLAPVREVFISPFVRPNQLLRHPDTRKPLTPRALGGPEIELERGKDPRVELFEWMRSADNPFFARSFVNRVWGHYFGIGIVHPVDDFSLANPPSNPKLLDALARDFVRNKYDIRALERAILNSRTYQLSSTANATNRHDRINYARSYVRPLMAEVVVDVLNDALGTRERWGPQAPAGARAIEVGASRIQNQAVAYAFRVFGRPPRTTACDCERALEPALPQKLFLMADAALLNKLRPNNNRLARLVVDSRSDGSVLDELFLATLSRLPTGDERKAFLDLRADSTKAPADSRNRGRALQQRRAAFSDVLWALVNTKEFIFNH